MVYWWRHNGLLVLLKVHNGLYWTLAYWWKHIVVKTVSNTFQEECIMSITCWVLLRLEKSIKVPEWTLNEVVRGHFRKTAATQNDGEIQRARAYPISRKICRISALTFIRGWRWPHDGGAPIASKLYSLNCLVRQDPLSKNNKIVPIKLKLYTSIYIHIELKLY